MNNEKKMDSVPPNLMDGYYNNDYTMLGKLCISDNMLFSFSSEFNLLFTMEKNESVYRVVEVDSIPHEKFFEKDLISEVVSWNNELILAPRNASGIYIKKNKEFSKISLDEYVESDLKHKFVSAFVYDDKLYLFGHWASKILGIDLSTERVEFVYDIPQEYIELRESANDAFFSNYYFNEDRVYLPFLSGAYIAVFDLIKKSVDWVKVYEKKIGLSSIYRYENGDLLLPCRGSGMFLYSEERKESTYILEDTDFLYALGVYSLESKIYVPCFRRGLYEIDVSNNSCKIDESMRCIELSVTHDGCYLLTDKGVILIEGNKSSFIEFDFSYADALLDSFLKEHESEFAYAVKEKYFVTLEEFIKIVANL